MRNQNVRELILAKGLVKKCIAYFKSNLPQESLTFAFGPTIEKPTGKVLIATQAVFPQDNDYILRSEIRCKVSFEFMLKNFPRFFKDDKELVLAWHSHPIDGLSDVDMEKGHLEMLKAYPNILTGYYHSGRFEFFQYKDENFEPVKHRIVEIEFYDRQMRAFGSDAQIKLITTHVALIGCGGSCPLTYLLAETGIGKLTLVDPDSWDKTSLNRVWVPGSHIGMNKAKSLQKLLRWRDVEVIAHPCAVEDMPREDLEDVDILIAFTDTFKSRIFVNRLALKMKKPTIFAASEIRAEGNQIGLMVGDCVVCLPGHTPCYECKLDVDPKRMLKETMNRKLWRRFAKKYGLPIDFPPVPSLASLNNVIASLVCDEVMKIVTGYAKPIHFQYWDHLNRKLTVLKAEKNPECPACREFTPVKIDENDLI